MGGRSRRWERHGQEEAGGLLKWSRIPRLLLLVWVKRGGLARRRYLSATKGSSKAMIGSSKDLLGGLMAVLVTSVVVAIGFGWAVASTVFGSVVVLMNRSSTIVFPSIAVVSSDLSAEKMPRAGYLSDPKQYIAAAVRRVNAASMSCGRVHKAVGV